MNAGEVQEQQFKSATAMTETAGVAQAAESASLVPTSILVGSEPAGVAVSPDGSHVYVANSGDVSVSVTDTNTKTVGTSINVGANPVGVAVTPNGKHVYVTNGTRLVSVINTNTKTTVGSPIDLGPGTFPRGVAMAPDGKRVYVANLAANTVAVIDTHTNMLVTTIGVDASPFGVAVTAQNVYVTNNGSNTVSAQ
jgi:YVTN family beta-propeller protein